MFGTHPRKCAFLAFAFFAPVFLPAVAMTPAAARKAPSPDLAASAYVQGRLAYADNHLAVAAERFRVAMQAGADDVLKRRALDVAILGGDLKSVGKLANSIELSAADDGMPGRGGDAIIALARAVAALNQSDWGAFEAARKLHSENGPGGDSGKLLDVLLYAYGLAGRGDPNAAIAFIDQQDLGGLGRSYLGEHRAHLLAIAKRWPEAADAYSVVVSGEGANVPRLRIAAAASALEASATDPAYGERAIVLMGGGSSRDPQLIEARQKLAANPKLAGRKLGDIPDRAGEGLALLFMRIANDLRREGSSGPALSFARLATLADGTQVDTWFTVADTLAAGGKPDLALSALDNVKAKGAAKLLADSRRATILASAGRIDEARSILQRITAQPDVSAEDWSRLADVERRAENYADAARYYGNALALLPAELNAARAQLLFLRGSAHEVSGSWPAAEADLRQALELEPESSIILNYLGYSLLDRKLKSEEAYGLIKRAFAAAPENGAIIDSMGWAEYIRGNYSEAVQLLEKARAAEPADPTIADHLGDALWKNGRKFEARHAWMSAADLSPEPKLRAALARKLDFGLDLALAGK